MSQRQDHNWQCVPPPSSLWGKPAATMSSLWRWPGGKHLRPPASSLLWQACKQMFPTLEMTAALGQLLDCNLTRDLKPQPSCYIPQKWEEITNVCCFKLLNVGKCCYSAIINTGAKGIHPGTWCERCQEWATPVQWPPSPIVSLRPECLKSYLKYVRSYSYIECLLSAVRIPSVRDSKAIFPFWKPRFPSP